MLLAAVWLCVAPGTSRAFARTADDQSPGPQSVPDTGRVAVTVTVLEGTVRLAGASVELRSLEGNVVLAKTVSDGSGQVAFPGVPPGRYAIQTDRPGFVAASSTPFTVNAGATTQVLVDLQPTFSAETEVRAPTSPTESVQPVASSDMLAGSVLDIAPLEGDDFQSLLPLLPGIVRGPDGRLRAKGGQPTQGALQISSASLTDPSSGDFDLELPGQSLESVEVLANPFAAEYGRFSSSVVQIRTKRATNEWEIKPGNLVPRFRKMFTGIRGFEPRFSVRGPLKRDRLLFSQDFQFRYVQDPVKSLPDEPEIGLTSFDSFTRIDGILSPRHSIVGLAVFFPREIEHLTMTTFRPPAATPEFNQSGTSVGVTDRFAISPTMVLESTAALRWFEISVNTDGREPMFYAPQSQGGSFFNDQEREVQTVQWIEALSISTDTGYGSHVFKFGLDLQDSRYDGTSGSRPVDILRLDGSLAERIVPSAPTAQEVSALELALFAQDRWRLGSRITFELGIRMDREDVIERVNWSPRAGVAVGVLSDGQGILRGGIGKFRQRTPLNVGAFAQFESRQVTRFGVDAAPIGAPITYLNVPASDLRTPEAVAGNIEWNQRFGRRVLFKVNYLQRNGSHEYIVQPDPIAGEFKLQSAGRSRYRELELTARYLGGERRDLTVSYVRSRGTADLNNYDQFYGNIRNPIVRANENNLIPTDVPHRLIVRGTFGLPAKWEIAPVIEIRSGFPFSAVDEFQDFVGARNRAGRFPVVRTIDFSISRPWKVKKYRFHGGLKVYNLLGASVERDVQSNITSPDYGRFFNPVERSIGFAFGIGD
jgi:hypothetical protein